ncbi:MAG: hypothetical protein LBP68_06065 [Acidobacteriota bacterium]|jgi:hypothetical protein|nr:hypothetical protein [Acidobacteriota bacterium]
MVETIAVCVIVSGVAVLAGRSIYKTLTGKNDACACGGKSCCQSGGCHQNKIGADKEP